MKNIAVLILISTFITNLALGQEQVNRQVPNDSHQKLAPMMGWASWNNYRANISEEIIRQQADKLVELGLDTLGYHYLNIDDGFFGGRDENGGLRFHPTRFPSGMFALSEYIHCKGLKAGIYSDAGINTCASYWDKDTIGTGMGLYGHDYQDLHRLLVEWDYDFIKVDWCGGDWLGLNEQVRYTQIADAIKTIKPEVKYNVCRWQFPGEWVTTIADSWRISGDIANKFNSVMHIVDLNAELWRYCSPGHYNDMDMLQVGRGMSYEEDKTHFSMWCLMSSPLMLGNDLTTISNETLQIISNRDLIAINQNPFAYQARKLVDNGDTEIYARPLNSTVSGKVAVALLNRSDSLQPMELNLETVGFNPNYPISYTDAWTKQQVSNVKSKMLSFDVPSHGITVLIMDGTMKAFNPFQYK